jgi:integrase
VLSADTSDACEARITVAVYWERFWLREVTVAKARATQQGYRAIFDSYVRRELGQERLGDLVEDRAILAGWRSRLAREKSHAVVVQARRVLSSMLSAAVEEGAIACNPLLVGERRGRSRKLTRSERTREPMAIDPAGWFLLMERLRGGAGGEERRRRARALAREHGALMVALGFMAGLRLPSEALALRRMDVHDGRLYIDGRSSAGEYTPGSKTGRGRDLPLLEALAVQLARVEQTHREAGSALAPQDFCIATRERAMWSEHQARNWRRREFKPAAREVAIAFPQFSALASATPYLTRHTFISCCLQAGVSLATISAWCGTSIHMISHTYGRMLRRYEGSAPVALAEQYARAKAEAALLFNGRVG